MQIACFAGLRPDQLNTLTKHMLEKLYAAYQSIMEKEVSTTFHYMSYDFYF
jgi:hypothetical protein